MTALSRIDIILTRRSLRSKANGSFRSCVHAALVEADRPKRAKTVDASAPIKDGML